VAYATLAQVKEILTLKSEDESEKTELEHCITAADAFIDARLYQYDTSGDAGDENCKMAASLIAAWIFSSRRSPDEAEKFFKQHETFLQAFITTDISGSIGGRRG